MPSDNLLFIDTNIWLDFYRTRNETGLQLLAHAEAMLDRLIVTYQLESEFKKNRQVAILEGMNMLKDVPQISRPGIFSDAKAVKVMTKHLKEAERRMNSLKLRMRRALANPGVHDPVYKVCQRVFHKTDDLNLTRKNPLRKPIRHRAFRRFLHGCPPRKKTDTSIGDAFNWEWMIHCATQRKSGLVIVSRDSDYGVTEDDKSYINDHLRQEFSERVSRKRGLVLCSRLSEALKLFAVRVSAEEAEAEKQLASVVIPPRPINVLPIVDLTKMPSLYDFSSPVSSILSATDFSGITSLSEQFTSMGTERMQAVSDLLSKQISELTSISAALPRWGDVNLFSDALAAVKADEEIKKKPK
jgi:PIN domain